MMAGFTVQFHENQNGPLQSLGSLNVVNLFLVLKRLKKVY